MELQEVEPPDDFSDEEAKRDPDAVENELTRPSFCAQCSRQSGRLAG